MAEEKTRTSGDLPRESQAAGPVLPVVNADVKDIQPAKQVIPSFVYVVAWISLSSSVILYNKWILAEKDFKFPVMLTTYHLAFASLMTQILARYSTLLDGRKTVKMTGRVYLRAIVPIGFFFSLSLIFGNLAYLYLSVAFIQMLKATTPVAVLLSSWSLGVSQPNLRVFLNVMIIVVGVVIATFGEIKFVMIGFVFQMLGITFEAVRLTMVQRLLSSAEYKMDPLVSLYYFAPICAVMNFAVALVWEVPKFTMAEFDKVGVVHFFLNGMCAFLLNVSVVFLIGKTSSLVLTLCGVLKDVMLVAASMILYGTVVTGLQFFGYSIALGGMVYYKLGYEQIKGYAGEAGRQWAEFGNSRPVLRKVSIIAMVVLTFFFLLGGLAPTYAPEAANQFVSDAAGKMGITTV